MSAPRASVGDRVEEAIERRLDVATEVAEGEERLATEPRRKWIRTGIWLGVTAISLYVVAPSLLDLLDSWRKLTTIQPWWFLGLAVCQAASLACLWLLQRLALRPVALPPVITSQLAGNALSKIAPGGGAVGAALQYRMLVQVGVDRERAVGGLTVVNLLVFAAVLSLPVLAIPALLRGGVSHSLLQLAIVGIVLFVVLVAIAAVLLALDGPLAWVGRLAQRVRNRLRRGKPAQHTLPDRLLAERDRILATFGPRWKGAAAATAGRWLFDYLTLLAALYAVGAHPRAGLVLLAFCGAQILAQIPLTPGGLGFVEAGLTGMLALAGVAAGAAVVATLAYRLFSYWLPLPLGLVGAILHRRLVASQPQPAPGPGAR
jgi:uncharacterized protein (TIRG00374 family)